jgi:hypothetical protein
LKVFSHFSSTLAKENSCDFVSAIVILRDFFLHIQKIENIFMYQTKSFQMHGKEHGGLHWDTDDIALVKLDRPICLVKLLSFIYLLCH